MPFIRKLKDAPRVPVKFDGRVMFTSPFTEVIHLTLKPGEIMDPHIQPFDVIFFVIEGSGHLLVGEENIAVKENTCVMVDKGKIRCFSNPGDQNLRILIIKELR